MQVLHRLTISIFALCLISAGAPAAPLATQELIEKSGLAGQLKELPGALQGSLGALRQQGAQIDAKFEKAWAEAIPAAYATEKFVAAIDAGLQKLLTAEDTKFLLAHYNSPLGLRITEMEVAAAKPEAQAETQAYAQKLMADPSKHADRLALYQEIDKATGATTMVTEISMNVAVAMAIGMTSAMEGPKDLDTSAIRAKIEQQRFAISQQLASMTLASFAYAYRDLKTEDLNAYLAFLNSPAAKKFNTGVGKLLGESLTSQSEAFGKELARNLGRKGV